MREIKIIIFGINPNKINIPRGIITHNIVIREREREREAEREGEKKGE